MASLTVFQQSEVVRKKKFPEWRVAQYNVLSDFFKQGEVEKVGERDFRIPAEVSLGGDAGTYDPQGGDMGRGSQPQGIAMIQSYFPMRMNFEFDKLGIMASTNTGIENPFLKCVSKGFIEFRRIRDKWYHGAGSAALATGTAYSNSSGVTVYTVDASVGTQWLYRGQRVVVYDTTQATIKGTFRLAPVAGG